MSNDETYINWKNTLTHYASISGVLAGFCVTFIALILSGAIADTYIFSRLTYGQCSILLFGISASFFICASELFLTAKECDFYDVSKGYIELFKIIFNCNGWSKFKDKCEVHCTTYMNYGRWLYNLAIFVIFFGLLFVIFPYNWYVAFLVWGLGISLELLQYKSVRKFLIEQRRYGV